jgi:hypothetical protein
MSSDQAKEESRSISVGGNVIGSALIAGDHNVISVNYQAVSLPIPDDVDVRGELQALREIIGRLESGDQRKIDNAFADVDEELSKPKPDREEVGKALVRVFDYAKKAEGFVGSIKKLQPHVVKAVAWLGENWHHLLPIFGLKL